MTYFNLFLIYLGCTIIIEMFVLYLCMRFLYKIPVHQTKTYKIIIAGFISAFTLPFVWFVFPNLQLDYFIYVIISELFALMIEMIFYKYFFNISWKKSFVISFICNLASYVFGLLILNNIFG